jgi:hypothetical protein
MLAVVVLDASASFFRSPSFLNNASHKPAGFCQAEAPFLSTMSNAVSTTDAGLYVVLGGHLSTPTKSRGRRRAETPNVNNYGRKQKPTAKRTRKHDKNEENT